MDSKKEHEQFTISQCGLLIINDKCLIGQFKYVPGMWGLPGGRIDKGENNEKAFKRELKEEINLSKFKVLGLVDFNSWYNPQGVARCAIVYLINADKSQIKIGDEFVKLKWVNEKDLDKIPFVWRHATKAIKKGFKMYRNIIN